MEGIGDKGAVEELGRELEAAEAKSDSSSKAVFANMMK